MYTELGRSVMQSFCYFQGGIKSVVWTDVFQCIILFVGLIIILVLVGVIVYYNYIYFFLFMCNISQLKIRGNIEVILFLFLHEKRRLSYEYPQRMFSWRK